MAGSNELPADRRRRLNTVAVRRYRATPKGRAAYTRYNRSGKAHAAQARYAATTKGAAKRSRYRKSEGGIILNLLRDRRLYFRVYNSTRRIK